MLTDYADTTSYPEMAVHRWRTTRCGTDRWGRCFEVRTVGVKAQKAHGRVK